MAHMNCPACEAWLTSEGIDVVSAERRTYRCGECEARIPPEHARTELFAWV